MSSIFPPPSYYGYYPPAPAGKWEPFLCVTDASSPPDTMVLLPGCLIVSTADARSEPTEVVSELFTQKLTFWHLQPDMQEALEEALCSLPLHRV